MMPTVSVLIPVHNSVRFVAETIECVLGQSRYLHEIIVFNDGSTDGSSDLVGSYGARLQLIGRPEPKGAANARNRAFEVSTGSHVLYLDSDDLVAVNHFQSLLGALERGTGRSVAFGRWGRFQHSVAAARLEDRTTQRDMPGLEWLMEEWQTGLPMTQCGMFLIPRVLVEEQGGWDERLSLIDDHEFFSRIIPAADRMLFAPEATLFYRSGVPGSLSRRSGRAATLSQFTSLMKATENVLARDASRANQRICANLLALFDYEHFPAHADLRYAVRKKVASLGGSDVQPIGPPNFHRLRRFVGWRMARIIQRQFAR